MPDQLQQGQRVVARMEQMLEWSKFPVETNFEIAKYDLLRLLEHAAKNSMWWRARMRRNFGKITEEFSLAEVLQRIPITTRKDMQDWGRLQYIQPPRGAKSAVTEFVTSGSTGQQTRGIKHAETYGINSLAFTLLEFKWFERSLAKSRFHLGFRRIDRDGVIGFPYDLLGEPTGNSFNLSYVNRSNKEVLDAMEQKPADYFVAPGNIAQAIARQAISDNRKIKFEQVLSFADPVTPATRALIHRAFGARVIDRYSCEEIGPLALQCPASDHLHVIEPLVHIEILNAQNQPVVADEIGRVVVTDLHSYAMPILRYELGDLARWELDPCPAGITWPAIKQILGRTRDGVVDADGNFRPVTFYKMPWEEWPHFVDEYVVLFQDHILAFVNCSRPMEDAEKQAIAAGLNKAFYSNFPVTVIQDVDLSELSPIKRMLYTRLDQPFDSGTSVVEIFQQVLQEQQARVEHVTSRYESDSNF